MYQGPRGSCLMKKTRGRKSRDTVPLLKMILDRNVCLCDLKKGLRIFANHVALVIDDLVKWQCWYILQYVATRTAWYYKIGPGK
jgi:hypothetical protein